MGNLTLSQQYFGTRAKLLMLECALQLFKSELIPKFPEGQNLLIRKLDAILQHEKTTETIYDFRVQCDLANNPPGLIESYCYQVELSIMPVQCASAYIWRLTKNTLTETLTILGADTEQWIQSFTQAKLTEYCNEVALELIRIKAERKLFKESLLRGKG